MYSPIVERMVAFDTKMLINLVELSSKIGEDLLLTADAAMQVYEKTGNPDNLFGRVQNASEFATIIMLGELAKRALSEDKEAMEYLTELV